MQRTLECAVCMHLYDARARLPKSLLCGHGYCLVCLNDMKRGSSITCPRCRSSCEVPNGQVSKFPTNYTIIELLDTVCKECQDRPHTKRCHHCNHNLCDVCQARHLPEQQTFDYSSSIKDLIQKLTKLEGASFAVEEDIRKEGDDLVMKLQKVHEEKIMQLQQIYEKQVSDVKSKVIDDTGAQKKWRNDIEKVVNEVKSLLNDCKAKDIDVQVKDRRYMKAKSSLEKIQQSRPGWNKMWLDDKLEEFQLLTAKSSKVNVMSMTNRPSVKKQLSCPVNDSMTNTAGNYTLATFKAMVGDRGTAHGDFKNPRGIAIGQMGEIFVADWLNDRLQVLDADLNTVQVIPIDGAFDLCKLDNYIFVTQSSKRQISVLSEHGDPLNVIGADQVKLEDPRGIACDQEGLLYICDSGNRCVKIIKASGDFVAEFGCDIFEDVGPRYIAVSRDKIYVSDNNYNLHTFSRSKRQLLNTMKGGMPPSNLRVTGITVDDDENIILSDSSGRLIVMKDGGRIISTIGSNGRKPGQLRGPEGVALTGQGELVVCDGGNDRVAMYIVPGLG